MVQDIIRNFFQDHANGKAFVLDGFECKYTSNISSIIKIITKIFLEKGRRLYVFHVTLDLQKLREKEQNFQTSQTEKKLSLLRVKELSEEDYDNLSQSEKESYDSAMLKYKKKVKELEEKRHKERRNVEEEIPKNGEKRANEERQKRRAPLKVQPNEKDKNASIKEKTSKKPLSPKFSRKQFGEKSDKHERDRIADGLGEDGIGEETFGSELTFRKMDLYYSNLETTISLFKDGKDIEKKVNISNLNPEKKSKATPKQVELVAPSSLDSDSHSSDDINMPEYHELNANIHDDESLFKLIAEVIPQSLKEDTGKLSSPYVVESWLEQIFIYRSDYPKYPDQKAFSLLSNFSVPEESELHNAESILPAYPTIIGPSIPVSKGLDGSKLDQKKGLKIVGKAADEKSNGLDMEEDQDKDSNTHYRWILQGGEKKDIVIRYSPIEAAKTEFLLNFKLPGWGQEFHLPITGFCQYSQIVADPKKIFEKIRKVKDGKDLVQGEFVLATSTYEFGPLLYNKPRDKYMEKFPENRAMLTISNPGSTEIKIFFGLKNDVKQDTYFFEPSNLSLLPGKAGVVYLWAYPKGPIQFEDLFIISIKDNPEPLMFKVNCIGVKPEIEIDKKTFNFEKMLVGRADKRELRIKNPTLMPLQWRIAGLELLGEEFNVHPMEGLISPQHEITITAEYRGTKASVIKRVIKFEITDPERICGEAQEIPILVTAEAYDIAMDIHFSKGFEGGIDFGAIKVLEEGKQLVTLKNKGKYEVGFKFLFDSPQFNEILTISPSHGIIQPSEKPYFVQIIFKANSELAFKDFQILKCIVFEPSTGEITATIPAKVSGRAVFSKYSILPVRDLNFGALVCGAKTAKQFTLENNGEFDFKFTIFKQQHDSKNSKKGRPASPPPAPKVRKDITKQTDSLSFGAFSVFPTSGVVLAGTKQLVTVDFHADSPGIFDEVIGIDVSDRSPLQMEGLEYQLLGESCIPGINTTDFSSIFEEQNVCKRLELFKTQNNVYGEEDRIFFFGAYLAGQQIQVQFKISNPFKVGCEVTCSTKSRGKAKPDSNDFAFDLEPKKLIIPSHEHRYVTVSFHPTSIQTYSGVFEAIVENVAEGKNKILTFELRGEGTLPRVNVEKPTLKSKTGYPLLKFRKLMIGASQILPILLKNDGIIPAKMKLEWAYKDNEDFFVGL